MQFKAKKSLGQNFLIDKNIAKKIVQYGKISPDDTVLEIGPGTGSLTSEIIKQKPKNIILIEKDNRLSEELIIKYGNSIKILNNDILQIEENNFSKEQILVFGNLPYNISTKILTKWICNIKNKFWFKKLLLMFQKEVAERIVAKSKTKDYGRLSIISQWKMNVKKIMDINPVSFYPKPKVQSTLLEFTPKSNFFDISDVKNLEILTKTLFNKRRKMIKNSIFNIVNKDDFANIKLNIDLNCRPQDLKPEQYYILTKEIEKLIK
tara:strand:- start:62 stop:853 length:792 start_codon:yes stop_codon:yes gene_type:complete